MNKVTTTKTPNLSQIAEKVLKIAQKNGATSAEIGIQTGKGFNVDVRLGKVETLEHLQDKKMEIVVFFDHNSGSVSTSNFDEQALEQAVEKACNIAKFTHPDPFSGLADKEFMAFNYPNLDLYHPWNITEQEAINLATKCETAGRNEDKRIVNSEGASISSYNGSFIYANSHGFLGEYASSSHNISCGLVASDGHEMQREYEYTSARDPQDLQDPIMLAKNLAQKTIKRLGAKKISTRQCAVIYLPEVARSLIAHFLTAIHGGKIYRKTSFLTDKLGQEIFPKNITITEHPHLLKGHGSAPFDAEGVRTSEKDFIKNGILENYILDAYSARKLNMQPTGNAGGSHNTTVSITHSSIDSLIKTMSTGLIVAELIGQGVNYVTGDYSRGVFGFWVEKGEIQYPVQEVTVAGNLKNMFLNVQGVADDVDRRGNVHTGSILVSDMTVAGV